MGVNAANDEVARLQVGEQLIKHPEKLLAFLIPALMRAVCRKQGHPEARCDNLDHEQALGVEEDRDIVLFDDNCLAVKLEGTIAAIQPNRRAPV